MTRRVTALAFDYGDRRIGVAVGQTVTGTASPLGSIRVKNGRPDWGGIAVIVQAWEPDLVVVGLPCNMDGTDQAITRSARRFARELGRRFGTEVQLFDERLSTREARARLVATGDPGGDDDPVAAQVILEGWLDEHRAD